MQKIINKNILITGASRGIGKALAEELSFNNNLVLLSKNKDNLNLLKAQLSYSKSKLFYKVCDVCNIQDVEDSFKFALDSLGSIDIIILNAGIGYRLDPKEYDLENNKLIIDTNFYGVLNFLKYFIPYFQSRKSGLIAGVSSLADVRGFPLSAAYSASKAALTSYLEALRIELKPENIRVVTVRPGFVDTDMIRNNKFKMYFIMSAKKAAKKIISGLESGRRIIQFPLTLRLLTSATKILPNFIYDTLLQKIK